MTEEVLKSLSVGNQQQQVSLLLKTAEQGYVDLLEKQPALIQELHKSILPLI